MFLTAVRRAMTGDILKSFKPLHDRVLVERAAAETKTKGGIMLPEKSQGKVLEATVLAVGPGARNEKGDVIPMSVKTGDRVLLLNHVMFTYMCYLRAHVAQWLEVPASHTRSLVRSRAHGSPSYPSLRGR
ncbi:hypothetical protein KIN20_011793 [Parelaphostrongylus tenuis]|uniref:10 kDa heat shock protein, mitochondrial n=1 Tax=Parelaphostrongylus tenuis TaxID=148309 RepID=A0AAD5QJY4_PARTN|nr:hypothetical protein KIN20_011793 [Parelaphostrongylus tenuis]